MFLLLGGCGDECSSYSNYTCKQIQNASYNVYFYFPNDTEVYLGETMSLDSCGAIAAGYASQKNVPVRWVCCMKTASSPCEGKHR